ncbi:Cation/H(+) antiporter 12 [Cardamine amara subsp. amara]|uniref:Cation/H(+) antiporter 12 n=1 Tax=Cardamine amara subsp. amara TaxID=228776 RepID=A0ABD1A266_CARAN
MNTTTYIDGCVPLVFNISSNGFWENLKSPDVIFGYSLPLTERQILIIFVFIILVHMIFRCASISPIPSYMIAGIILGPQLFNLREESSRRLY